MKVVIADTSPLNYLVLIDLIAILPRLYGTVIVPEEVLAELSDPATPVKVLQWIDNRPEWLHVQSAPRINDASLSQLDPGERAAILLAEQHGRDTLLLIDDGQARIETSRRNIATVGTLGVLRAAAMQKLLDLPSALDRLLNSNFRVSAQLVAELIAEDRNRKSSI